MCILARAFTAGGMYMHMKKKFYASSTTSYNPFLVYCRELAPGTISLTRGRAQSDDSKHGSHYSCAYRN